MLRSTTHRARVRCDQRASKCAERDDCDRGEPRGDVDCGHAFDAPVKQAAQKKSEPHGRVVEQRRHEIHRLHLNHAEAANGSHGGPESQPSADD